MNSKVFTLKGLHRIARVAYLRTPRHNIGRPLFVIFSFPWEQRNSVKLCPIVLYILENKDLQVFLIGSTEAQSHDYLSAHIPPR